MASFTLNSIIKIGAYKPFKGANEITIKKSIRNFNDTAVIKLPTTAVLKQKDPAQSTSLLTAQAFKRGDKVNIQLGYNGVMREEFEGFVSRINKTTPCEIECDGYAFQLRNKQVNKIWKSTTLKEVLTEIIKDTDIVLSPETQDIKIDRMELPKMNGFSAMQHVQKQCGKVVALYFTKNVLYGGLALEQLSEKNKQNKADVKYKIGYNVVRDGQMKERKAGDDTYEVEFIHKEKTGKKTIAKVGLPNSNSVRKRVQAIKDADFLKRMATEEETSKNYTGFDGKITGFLQPFCIPGNKMAVEDPKYPDRSGNYLVEATELKYGTSGARRTVKISIKL